MRENVPIMVKSLKLIFKKQHEDLQIVFGEVYAPNVPDSHGDFMLAEDIQKMAHQFVRSLKVRKVDINHNNDPVDASVVESFIAPEEDKTFIPGSWVVGVKVNDPKIWKKIKEGVLNGFSFEATVLMVKQTVILSIPAVMKGDTQEAKASDEEEEELHKHKFEVRFSQEGKFLGGKTTKNNGHSHTIKSGTTTEQADGHAHRYSFLEQVTANARN